MYRDVTDMYKRELSAAVFYDYVQAVEDIHQDWLSFSQYLDAICFMNYWGFPSYYRDILREQQWLLGQLEWSRRLQHYSGIFVGEDRAGRIGCPSPDRVDAKHMEALLAVIRESGMDGVVLFRDAYLFESQRKGKEKEAILRLLAAFH